MFLFCENAKLLIAAISACNLPESQILPSPTQPSTTFESTPNPTLIAKEPDVAHHPLYWFGPLPPLPLVDGRPFTGSDDFMQPFEADAPWQTSAGKIQVFKLYGEWVSTHPGDTQLKKVIDDLNRQPIIVVCKWQEPSNPQARLCISLHWMNLITMVVFTMDPCYADLVLANHILVLSIIQQNCQR